MIKRNILKVIISTVIILLPIIFGIIVWDSLPDVITTHFGADGVPDGTSSKAFAVFGLPVFMLLLHWVCITVTAIADARGKRQSDKIYGIIFYVFPLLSLAVSSMIYSVALGGEMSVGILMAILFGVMFILMGNYLPKATRNRYFGIKIKWTLDNDENWAATHRLAGKVWFFGGFAVMLTAFLPTDIMLAALIAMPFVLILVPTVYSYVFYRKQLASGKISKESTGDTLNKKSDKIIGVAVAIFIAILFAAVAVLMFTGNITAVAGDDALSVDATYYDSLTLKYERIDSVEYCESGNLGTRQYGYGSAKLSLGIFKSEELGSYTRYTYNAVGSYILITSEGRTLVINLATDVETKAFYEELILKIGE